MNKKNLIIVLLLAINLAVTAFMAVYTFVPFDNLENSRHVLYVGLNDRYINEQIIGAEDAVATAIEIVGRHTDGWTLTLGQGGWTNEHGVLIVENNMVFTLIGAEEEAVWAIMDELLAALNQNTILMEYSTVTSIFYSGVN